MLETEKAPKTTPNSSPSPNHNLNHNPNPYPSGPSPVAPQLCIAHFALSWARRARSCWEKCQLRGEGQGNSAPLKIELGLCLLSLRRLRRMREEMQPPWR